MHREIALYMKGSGVGTAGYVVHVVAVVMHVVCGKYVTR